MIRPAQPSVPYPRTERASQMRADFDATFSRPAVRPESDLEDVIALRLGGEPYVLRLRDLAGVIAHPVITAVPTAVPALLGVTSNRGSVLAAYDLCLLRDGPPTPPRWLVVSAAEPKLGLTFEHFDGYHRISRSTGLGRLIELTAVVETIKSLVRRHLPQFRAGDEA